MEPKRKFIPQPLPPHYRTGNGQEDYKKYIKQKQTPPKVLLTLGGWAILGS